jgi:hypothetical protein
MKPIGVTSTSTDRNISVRLAAALALSAVLLAGTVASAAQELVWSPDQSSEKSSGSGSGGGMGGMGGSTAEWNVESDDNWVISPDKTTSTDFKNGDSVYFVTEKSEGDDSGFDMSGMMSMFGMGGRHRVGRQNGRARQDDR